MRDGRNLVVLKLGSEVVADPRSGQVQEENLDELSRQAGHLYNNGLRPVIVTSGAISLARGDFDLSKQPVAVEREQALSSYGQPRVFEEYQWRLANWSMRCGQFMVSQANFKDDTERKNLRGALTESLALGLTPIINENDAVATEELRTDNDVIAGKIATLLRAKALVLITQNVDGLHDDIGGVISRVNIDEQESVEAFVSDTQQKFARGGMKSKNKVAGEAARAGVDTLIMGSRDLKDLEFAFRGQFGTHYMSENPLQGLGYTPTR